MKNIFLLLLLSVFFFRAQAQDFSKNLTAARTAYTAGNLGNSRFAMEQMLREIDAAIGKDILKLLPTKMDALTANTKDDNTTGSGSTGGMGLFVQRTYGTGAKTASIDVINNSPLINSLNTFLAIPFVGNSGDGKQKVVKVQGYKAVLYKNEDTETKKVNYDLQIPMQNTLVNLKMDDTKEADILRLADTIPLEKIAQLAK
ncbi:hypothetical protein AAE02nite_33880 [Adhaeribacter aerolatus]|uniref:DUF4251 domain-containing protein n=1 Tax=Adhaeribacter aerolatus TaxID=670289 RepID=A0A512B179_9BACT|nr:hypothetical protein [Adhaeribacter aerolatus]GEO05724.1 hypothetical protein AAE02nite_33880 [Adhaeribacter aerolatus]